ncbi:hypothetical protein D770_12665 [Flammeovirgaceae bacterium 311]|nr:hypothetical protein D770_12665 [Flammeovirgaceae bacterium 311]
MVKQQYTAAAQPGRNDNLAAPYDSQPVLAWHLSTGVKTIKIINILKICKGKSTYEQFINSTLRHHLAVQHK